ncbi:MAG: hypothetical protein M3Q77_00410 [Thermoproteota archaeon]|nr:hypothetical protein [Thermoproteota archaeon]
MTKVEKINLLQIFNEKSIGNNINNNDYNMIINTHGDIDPYYDYRLTKNNTITYCHYPSAKTLIESNDANYFNYHLRINRVYSSLRSSDFSKCDDCSMISLSENHKTTDGNKNVKGAGGKRQYIEWIKPTLFTNSSQLLLIHFYVTFKSERNRYC